MVCVTEDVIQAGGETTVKYVSLLTGHVFCVVDVVLLYQYL